MNVVSNLLPIWIVNEFIRPSRWVGPDSTDIEWSRFGGGLIQYFSPLPAVFRDLLVHLNSEQLDMLEQALCSAEGLGKLERNKLKAAAKRKSKGRHGKGESETSRPTATETTSSSTVPEVPERTSPSLNSASEETSSGRGLVRRQLFEPSPVRVPEHNLMAAEDDLQAEVLITEPFPQFGANRPIDNDLPSSSSSTSHSEQHHHPNVSESKPEHQHIDPADVSKSCNAAPPSPTPPPSNATAIPSTSAKPKGVAGFPSVEDLMHRLFLGISGVADQLQTNHAKDLRVILKSVFTVCQSEPDDSADIIRAVAQGSRPEGRSHAEEPQSPLITRSNSKSRLPFPLLKLLHFFTTVKAINLPSPTTFSIFFFSSSSLFCPLFFVLVGFNFELDSVERSPSWIPDADSPVCFTCSERFSWKRRRHHCRGCGHVSDDFTTSTIKKLLPHTLSGSKMAIQPLDHSYNPSSSETNSSAQPHCFATKCLEVKKEITCCVLKPH